MTQLQGQGFQGRACLDSYPIDGSKTSASALEIGQRLHLGETQLQLTALEHFHKMRDRSFDPRSILWIKVGLAVPGCHPEDPAFL